MNDMLLFSCFFSSMFEWTFVDPSGVKNAILILGLYSNATHGSKLREQRILMMRRSGYLLLL